MAAMAKGQKLVRWEKLKLIEKFSSRFGQHPDTVYKNTSFDTIIAFAEMWKDEEEFNERFQYIWREINTTPTGK